MNKLGALAVLVLLSIPVGSGADVYKCVSKDGIVKFSDQPCSPDAEVAFPTPDTSFDHVIGNGGVYPEPVPVDRFDIEDLTAHAKKIGKCIITGEQNNTAFYRGTPGQALLEWYIQLNFGPSYKKKKYVVRLTYKGASDGTSMYVWLDSFTVKKNGQLYDPSTVSGSKKYIKKGTGRWCIEPKLKNQPSLLRLKRVPRCTGILLGTRWPKPWSVRAELMPMRMCIGLAQNTSMTK